MDQKKKPFQLTQLLFFGFSPFRRTEVEKIHRYYAKYYWKKTNWKKKIVLIKKFILSPVTIGKEIRRETSKSPGRKQALHRFYLAFFYDISNKDYDLMGFGRNNRGDLKKYYLQERTLKYSLYKLLRQYGKHLYPSAVKVYLGDKDEFYRYCCQEGIPTVPLIDPFGPLPGKDLFIKPRVGKEGRGSQAWYYEDGIYRGSNGLKRSADELQREVRDYAEADRNREMILQPLIRPHKALEIFYNQATPTIRIFTYIDSKGAVQTGPCMIRFNLEEKAITDNASTGGEVAPIDAAEGMIKKPHAIKIPFWQESCQEVLRAHKTMKDRIIIGWDILITEDGPLVLEANSQPGLIHLQKAHGISFGKEPMIKALGHHIKNAWDILKRKGESTEGGRVSEKKSKTK